jgi:hypothetical protein
MYSKPKFFNDKDEIYCRDLALALFIESDANFTFDLDSLEEKPMLMLEYSSAFCDPIEEYFISIPWYIVPLLTCLEDYYGYEAIYAWAAIEKQLEIEDLQKWVIDLIQRMRKYSFYFEESMVNFYSILSMSSGPFMQDFVNSMFSFNSKNSEDDFNDEFEED